MILDVIQWNYACVVMCILFFIFVLTDRSFDRKTERMFAVTITIVLILSIVDILELVESTKEAPTFLRRFYSAVGYSLRPTTAIMVVLVMYRNKLTSLKTARVLILLALFVVNAVVCVVSIWIPIVFFYDQNNDFNRGPLGLFPFVTAGVYILFMVVTTIMTVNKRLAGETAVIIAIGVLSFMGTILESAFQLEATLNVSCAIGVLFYYLYLYVSIYSRDSLTDAYNRRIFYMDVDKMHPGKDYLVAIDLNNLKKINDEQGHAAGDVALITLANVIKTNRNRGCMLYRMGGDEFTILCQHTTLKEVENMMKIIEWEMNNTDYSFAYGIALYARNGDIDAATNEADAKMYAMKKAMKAERV